MSFQGFREFVNFHETQKGVKYTEGYIFPSDTDLFEKYIYLAKRPFSATISTCKYIPPRTWCGRAPILSFGDGDWKIGVGDLMQTILKEANFEVLSAPGRPFGPIYPLRYLAHMGGRVFVEYSIGVGGNPEYYARIIGGWREVEYRTGDIQMLLGVIIHTTRDMWERIMK